MNLHNNDLNFKRAICQQFDAETDYSEADDAEIDGAFDAIQLQLLAGFNTLAFQSTNKVKAINPTIELGSNVTWKHGAGDVIGKVEKLYPKRTALKIKDLVIVRNGTPENPAILIIQDDGTKVLKLLSEVESLDYVEFAEEIENIAIQSIDFSEVIRQSIKEELRLFEASFANATKQRNCKNSTTCGKSCIKTGLICWTDLSPANKIVVKKLIQELKALKSSNKSAKENKTSFDYIKLSDEFKKQYYQERNKQELKGVVAIKKEQLEQRMLEQGVTKADYEKLYKKLKDDGKIFTVNEKGSELMQWSA